MINLLLAVLLLELGSGLQGILIPINGELGGFPTAIIGGVGALYYVGFVLGCIVLPGTVRRVGHIRCFSALAAVAASTVLLHALFVIPSVWLFLRAIAGFCFAGLFMVLESWLNDRATSSTRGQVLARYMAATWVGVIGGKLLFALASAEAFHLFALASILVGLSLVPLALTNTATPAIPRPEALGLVELYRMAPAGLIGSVAVGMINGAFWTFAPLFALARVESSLWVGLFMSACVIGGAVSQWPIGKLSDRVDRRWAILVFCLASAAAGLLLALAAGKSEAPLLALGALFGASALSLYPLCVAYANDRADPGSFVEVSSHLLLAFGIGAIGGPFLAGLLISETSVASLFLFTATIDLAFAVFVLIAIRRVAPVAEAERAVFAPHPPISHGTQALLELQPGADVLTEPHAPWADAIDGPSDEAC